MDITLNNLELENASNIICFTDIPNILKVSDSVETDYSSFTLTIDGNLSSITSADTQWTITIMDSTISNVLSYNSAINRTFYVANDNTSTAASIARALRNCPQVQASFNIEHNGAFVRLDAKEPGEVLLDRRVEISSNIPGEYLNITGYEAQSTSPLYGAKVDVDIYHGDTYVTTLEKNFYDGEAAFNITPVITTMADYGTSQPFSATVSSIKNGQYSKLGDVDTNYVSVGYMVNQGAKYLFNTYQIAQNNTRGVARDFENNTLLYIYKPEIPISFYRGDVGGMQITIDYLNSAGSTLSSTTTTWRNTDSSKVLVDLTLYLDETWFNQAFYIDLSLGNIKLRYNVIKPLKATEHCQRILFRNSYGGISFIDLTGSLSVNTSLETSTYQKNIYDYYDTDMNELEKTYDVQTKYTYTLKSHLFEKDGKWIYNDLLQSGYIWTLVNNEKYLILLDDVTVDEVEGNNDIYQASVKFHFSQPTTII